MQGDMCHGDGVTHPTHLPWGWGTPQQLLCMSLLGGGGVGVGDDRCHQPAMGLR